MDDSLIDNQVPALRATVSAAIQLNQTHGSNGLQTTQKPHFSERIHWLRSSVWPTAGCSALRRDSKMQLMRLRIRIARCRWIPGRCSQRSIPSFASCAKSIALPSLNCASASRLRDDERQS